MPESEKNIDIAVKDPEAEKRRKKRQLLEINVLTISAIFCVIAVFMIFGKRPTQSYEEKRDLAKRPDFTIEGYLDGSFTSEFSAWFNDAVPLRSNFKSMIADFREHLGIPYEEGILIGNIPSAENDASEPKSSEPETLPAVIPTKTSAPDITEPATTPPPTEPTEDEDTDGETVNDILVLKDRGLMLFGGSRITGKTYAETVNQYQELLGTDVQVYSLIAPTAVSFYLPKKFESASASEAENIDYINTFLKDVIPVDAFSALDAHKEEAIYSRTDHHWQALGAYYAAEAFAKEAGVPFAPLSDYEQVVKEGYVGTLYGFTNSAALKNNPEDFIYYVPQNTITTTYYDPDMTNEREAPLMLNLDNVEPSSWYLVFMGGDERITHIETDCHNGRILCIIKDSYGNALVPCLTSSFEEIWVIDIRFFEPNVIQFMQERDVTDVLFAMNTFSVTGTNSEKLQTILNQ